MVHPLDRLGQPAGSTSLRSPGESPARPMRKLLCRTSPSINGHLISPIGEAVSSAASHETCPVIFGLSRNKRILHDITFRC
jgi:hypothetical protein